MAPVKALCSERFEDWKQKFGPLGLKCMELTGDTEIDDYMELQDVHIVLTTPVRQKKLIICFSDTALVNFNPLLQNFYCISSSYTEKSSIRREL